MSEKQREDDPAKRALMIDVLDKGLLGLREAGLLANLLEVRGEGRGHCGCDSVCSNCKAKCGGCAA